MDICIFCDKRIMLCDICRSKSLTLRSKLIKYKNITQNECEKIHDICEPIEKDQ